MEPVHVTDEQLEAFFDNRMTPDGYTAFLTHLSQCEFCAGRMAAHFPENQLLTAPPDMKESLLAQAAASRKPFYQKRPLLFYSARVCAAAASAIALLILTAFLESSLPQRSSAADYETYVAGREAFLQKETQAWRSRAEKNAEKNWVNRIGEQLNRFFQDNDNHVDNKNGGNLL